jgi:hypothetical protein
MPYALDIKDADRNSIIQYRGRVHHAFTMREVLPIMWLLEEVKHTSAECKPKVHSKVLEENAGSIEIANVSKMRPRIKHLNMKNHHFREEVKKGTVSIYYTRTEDHITDIFTKPLPETSFSKFRERIMGW